jgi:hypothetical protein
VVAEDRTAEQAWRDLCASHPGACQRAYDQLATDPRHVDGSRWIELRGKHAGIRQHEIGGGARLWFRLDEGRRIVLIRPWPGHPKKTESRNR